MMLAFNTSRIDIYVDAVEYTRDGSVLPRGGLSLGDDGTTMFFKVEEKILVFS